MHLRKEQRIQQGLWQMLGPAVIFIETQEPTRPMPVGVGAEGGDPTGDTREMEGGWGRIKPIGGYQGFNGVHASTRVFAEPT